jgi:thioredoxin-dependent peroxiredoxin
MLKVGDKAPNFSVEDDNGEKVSLKDFKGKTVVLYFYPKDMTSGCTIEACDFRDLQKKFQKKDAVILGVSKDSIERHKKFKGKYDLNFALLADTEGDVCKSYDVIQEKSMYGRKFMGIVRTTYVIGPDQKIQKIYNKVKVKDHAKAVFEGIE